MIVLYKENNYETMMEVWEASVRSTHYFLSDDDILFYRNIIPSYFKQVELYVIFNEDGRITSFMGLSEDMIEMLFVDPSYHCKGQGKMLLNFAVHDKRVYKVDVNEQNGKGYRFYKHMGFEVTGRDAVDSNNRPFPILHMEFTDKK